MSIILKGINLPSKNARDYIIIGWYENNTHGGLDLKSKFVECADVIQIPKGHGRLIDGDKFKETMGDTNMDIYTDEVKEHIDDAPTILEAEEDEC